MRTVSVGNGPVGSSVLGFGCSGVMGRVGRRGSLAALGAAYEAGITFYDTARSYGYGEAEGLLGEFLRGRRDSVVVSTKFGIVPAKTSLLKRVAKPVARLVLRAAPGLRRSMQGQIAAQFSPGHFTVEAMRASLEASLRSLQTGYVDFLFLHLPPLSAVHQEDLIAALEQLSVEGKVLRAGVAADADVALAALDAGIPTLRAVQFPCNLFEPGVANRPGGYGSDVVAIANHPFGGPLRVAEGKAMLRALAQSATTPESLRAKLGEMDDRVFADVVLNVITQETAIRVVVPSMLRLEHLRANVAAMEGSRFTVEELQWVREQVGSAAKTPIERTYRD